jgi:acetyltransferase
MGDYPRELERRHTLADGRVVVIRPIRPEDDAAAKAFFDRLGPEARRLRFMKWLRSVSSGLVHTFTHVDYEQRMAFVAEADGGGSRQIVGEARYAAVPRSMSCDFAIVVADDWHKSGLAGLLMLALMDCARAHGFESMESVVLRENHDMLSFARALGFEARPVPQEPTLVQVAMPLVPYAARAGSRKRA